MSYPLIIETLLEFELITNEQAIDALAQHEREVQEYEARKELYRQNWMKRFNELPWWKRQLKSFWEFGLIETRWHLDWIKEPMEVRYPPEWLR